MIKNILQNIKGSKIKIKHKKVGSILPFFIRNSVYFNRGVMPLFLLQFFRLPKLQPDIDIRRDKITSTLFDGFMFGFKYNPIFQKSVNNINATTLTFPNEICNVKANYLAAAVVNRQSCEFHLEKCEALTKSQPAADCHCCKSCFTGKEPH